MPAKEEINHGSHHGAQQHYKRGEKPCSVCRRAANEYVNTWRRNRSMTSMQYRVGTMIAAFADSPDHVPTYSPIFESQDAVDEYLNVLVPASEQSAYVLMLVWVEEVAEPNWKPM